LVSDNQVLSKNIYIKELNKYPTIQHGCTLDGISLEHGENYSFYQNTFSFNCSNEVSVLFCDNGVLEHSDTYKYHSCNTYNTCSIGGQTLEHNTSQIFYFKSFDEDGCINETRTCNNGVLNGSYTYTNCLEQLVSGTGETQDILIEDVLYRFHIFKNVGEYNITVLKNDLQVEYLIVAGGGGAGAFGSGGGAGGILAGSKNLSIGTKTIIVGAGGLGAIGWDTISTNGFNSMFDDLTAIGGGHGGVRDVFYDTINAKGGPGASGGGGSHGRTSTGWTAGGENITTDQGHKGGRGYYTYGLGVQGGGGGGAGEPGKDSGTGAWGPPGRGGDGLYSKNNLNFKTDFKLDVFGIGESSEGQIWLGGGGSGACHWGPEGNGDWLGGKGGGGAGQTRGSYSGIGTNGLANTGGGGGAGNPKGGLGGSGLVIIRYAIN